MPTGASPLSLAAAGFYVLVVIAVCIGAAAAKRHNQQNWHRHSWQLLAALYIILSLFRLMDVEELLRDQLRDAFRSDMAYTGRDDLQRPVTIAVIVIFAAGAFWSAYRISRSIKGRRNFAVIAALAGCLGMLVLIALRIISLHPIDALLYGPAKLNWLGDIGLSCVVAGAALYYTRVTLSSP